METHNVVIENLTDFLQVENPIERLELIEASENALAILKEEQMKFVDVDNKIDKATELFNSMPKELISKLGDSYLNDDLYEGLERESRIEIMAHFLALKFEQHIPTTKVLAKLVLEDYEKNLISIENNSKVTINFFPNGDEEEKKELLVLLKEYTYESEDRIIDYLDLAYDEESLENFRSELSYEEEYKTLDALDDYRGKLKDEFKSEKKITKFLVKNEISLKDKYEITDKLEELGMTIINQADGENIAFNGVSPSDLTCNDIYIKSDNSEYMITLFEDSFQFLKNTSKDENINYETVFSRQHLSNDALADISKHYSKQLERVDNPSIRKDVLASLDEVKTLEISRAKEGYLFAPHDAKDTASAMKELSKPQNLDYK